MGKGEEACFRRIMLNRSTNDRVWVGSHFLGNWIVGFLVLFLELSLSEKSFSISSILSSLLSLSTLPSPTMIGTNYNARNFI